MAGALHAATIRGTVVENQTGHPLARATVGLQPVAGSSGAGMSVHTDSYGRFEFQAVPAGSYLISAARLAFAPVQFGQKRWHSAGVPLTVAADDAPSLSIRLPRYGAIEGSVLDENEVGLPEHNVAVYTNTRPPKLLARARTDDRGVYRLFGLLPGSYLVRTLAKANEDTTYLPTFFRDVTTVEQARAVEVALDQQIDRVDIHAVEGRLFSVAGRLLSPYSGPMTVTLVSDTGTQTVSTDSSGSFQFNPAAPGQYELLAEGQYPYATPGQSRLIAGYQPLAVDRDLTDIRVSLGTLPVVQFVFEDAKGRAVDWRQLRVLARRKDLSGSANPETLQVVFDDKPPDPRASLARRAGATAEPNTGPLRAAAGRVQVLPGRWDVAVAPNVAYSVVGFTPPQPDAAERGRADGWNELLLASGSQNVVRFVVSSTPSTLSGTVKSSGGDALAGVPVFMEAYDLDPRKRLSDIRMTRTNGQGQYRFGGLAPGVYRLLGTFDYQMPDSDEMEAAHAVTVKVEEGHDAALDLEEFVIR